MEVKIERINDTGEGIGFLDRQVVFVPKTIPGDIVMIKDINKYKNYMRASVDNYIEYSKLREEAKCPYFSQCGGCQLMNINYQKQLEYKKNKVINIFKKYGNIDINPEIISDKQYKYRNKIVLEVRNGKIGLNKYHSHDIVYIDKCLLVSDNINKIIDLINNNLDLTGINKIMIRESTSKDIMVVFYGNIDINKVKELLNDKVESCYLNDRLIIGNKYIITKLNNYSYTLSPNSFFQVNYDMTIKLYNKVLEYISNGDNVMDLYCGTGSIGIYISNKVSNILGVEIVKDAINNANINKRINNINNINFKCGDVEKIINKNDKYDTIIVDPPRAGLSKKTRDILLDINSNKIIYVSCNPMTLVRDIKYLSNHYELKDITLFDMFPNTYHVESVVVLERN
ncbi:MAG: class I SAM-dependent RNA methyltransferase [Bacilli bacterium]|nr:class I SAM-dependent RNA methyltransferase [Bacilli bacterium]